MAPSAMRTKFGRLKTKVRELQLRFSNDMATKSREEVLRLRTGVKLHIIMQLRRSVVSRIQLMLNMLEGHLQSKDTVTKQKAEKARSGLDKILTRLLKLNEKSLSYGVYRDTAKKLGTLQEYIQNNLPLPPEYQKKIQTVLPILKIDPELFKRMQKRQLQINFLRKAFRMSMVSLQTNPYRFSAPNPSLKLVYAIRDKLTLPGLKRKSREVKFRTTDIQLTIVQAAIDVLGEKKFVNKLLIEKNERKMKIMLYDRIAEKLTEVLSQSSARLGALGADVKKYMGADIGNMPRKLSFEKYKKGKTKYTRPQRLAMAQAKHFFRRKVTLSIDSNYYSRFMNKVSKKNHSLNTLFKTNTASGFDKLVLTYLSSLRHEKLYNVLKTELETILKDEINAGIKKMERYKHFKEALKKEKTKEEKEFDNVIWPKSSKQFRAHFAKKLSGKKLDKRVEEERKYHRKNYLATQLQAFKVKHMFEYNYRSILGINVGKARFFAPPKSGLKLKAWKMYNEIFDPNGEFFNIADTTKDTLYKETLINAPLILASGGVIAAVARGAGRYATGFAVRRTILRRVALAELATTGNIAIGQAFYQALPGMVFRNAFLRGTLGLSVGAGSLLMEGASFEVGMHMLEHWLFADQHKLGKAYKGKQKTSSEWMKRILFSSMTLGLFHGAGRIARMRPGATLTGEAAQKALANQGFLGRTTATIGGKETKVFITGMKQTLKDGLVVFTDSAKRNMIRKLISAGALEPAALLIAGGIHKSYDAFKRNKFSLKDLTNIKNMMLVLRPIYEDFGKLDQWQHAWTVIAGLKIAGTGVRIGVGSVKLTGRGLGRIAPKRIKEKVQEHRERPKLTNEMLVDLMQHKTLRSHQFAIMKTNPPAELINRLQQKENDLAAAEGRSPKTITANDVYAWTGTDGVIYINKTALETNLTTELARNGVKVEIPESFEVHRSKLNPISWILGTKKSNTRSRFNPMRLVPGKGGRERNPTKKGTRFKLTIEQSGKKQTMEFTLAELQKIVETGEVPSRVKEALRDSLKIAAKKIIDRMSDMVGHEMIHVIMEAKIQGNKRNKIEQLFETQDFFKDTRFEGRQASFENIQEFIAHVVDGRITLPEAKAGQIETALKQFLGPEFRLFKGVGRDGNAIPDITHIKDFHKQTLKDAKKRPKLERMEASAMSTTPKKQPKKTPDNKIKTEKEIENGINKPLTHQTLTAAQANTILQVKAQLRTYRMFLEGKLETAKTPGQRADILLYIQQFNALIDGYSNQKFTSGSQGVAQLTTLMGKVNEIYTNVSSGRKPRKLTPPAQPLARAAELQRQKIEGIKTEVRNQENAFNKPFDQKIVDGNKTISDITATGKSREQLEQSISEAAQNGRTLKQELTKTHATYDAQLAQTIKTEQAVAKKSKGYEKELHLERAKQARNARARAKERLAQAKRDIDARVRSKQIELQKTLIKSLKQAFDALAKQHEANERQYDRDMQELINREAQTKDPKEKQRLMQMIRKKQAARKRERRQEKSARNALARTIKRNITSVTRKQKSGEINVAQKKFLDQQAKKQTTETDKKLRETNEKQDNMRDAIEMNHDVLSQSQKIAAENRRAQQAFETRMRTYAKKAEKDLNQADQKILNEQRNALHREAQQEQQRIIAEQKKFDQQMDQRMQALDKSADAPVRKTIKKKRISRAKQDVKQSVEPFNKVLESAMKRLSKEIKIEMDREIQRMQREAEAQIKREQERFKKEEKLDQEIDKSYTQENKAVDQTDRAVIRTERQQRIAERNKERADEKLSRANFQQKLKSEIDAEIKRMNNETDAALKKQRAEKVKKMRALEKKLRAEEWKILEKEKAIEQKRKALEQSSKKIREIKREQQDIETQAQSLKERQQKLEKEMREGMQRLADRETQNLDTVEKRALERQRQQLLRKATEQERQLQADQQRIDAKLDRIIKKPEPKKEHPNTKTYRETLKRKARETKRQVRDKTHTRKIRDMMQKLENRMRQEFDAEIARMKQEAQRIEAEHKRKEQEFDRKMQESFRKEDRQRNETDREQTRTERQDLKRQRDFEKTQEKQERERLKRQLQSESRKLSDRMKRESNQAIKEAQKQAKRKIDAERRRFEAFERKLERDRLKREIAQRKLQEKSRARTFENDVKKDIESLREQKRVIEGELFRLDRERRDAKRKNEGELKDIKEKFDRDIAEHMRRYREAERKLEQREKEANRRAKLKDGGAPKYRALRDRLKREREKAKNEREALKRKIETERKKFEKEIEKAGDREIQRLERENTREARDEIDRRRTVKRAAERRLARSTARAKRRVLQRERTRQRLQSRARIELPTQTKKDDERLREQKSIIDKNVFEIFAGFPKMMSFTIAGLDIKITFVQQKTTKQQKIIAYAEGKKIGEITGKTGQPYVELMAQLTGESARKINEFEIPARKMTSADKAEVREHLYASLKNNFHRTIVRAVLKDRLGAQYNPIQETVRYNNKTYKLEASEEGFTLYHRFSNRSIQRGIFTSFEEYCRDKAAAKAALKKQVELLEKLYPKFAKAKQKSTPKTAYFTPENVGVQVPYMPSYEKASVFALGIIGGTAAILSTSKQRATSNKQVTSNEQRATNNKQPRISATQYKTIETLAKHSTHTEKTKENTQISQANAYTWPISVVVPQLRKMGFDDTNISGTLITTLALIQNGKIKVNYKNPGSTTNHTVAPGANIFKTISRLADSGAAITLDLAKKKTIVKSMIAENKSNLTKHTKLMHEKWFEYRGTKAVHTKRLAYDARRDYAHYLSALHAREKNSTINEKDIV